MKALEFHAELNADDTLIVPADVAAHVERGQPLRVILILPESADEREWKELVADQFLKGYAESDAIYDDVPAG